MSAKTEQRLLEGLKSFRKRPPRRMRLGQAADIVGRLERLLGSAEGVELVVAAGSFRRRRETVADIDILVETDAPDVAIDKLQRSALVDKSDANPGGNPRAAGGRAGANRATVQLLRGPQVDVMTMLPGRAGTYLVHFTGSASTTFVCGRSPGTRAGPLSEHGFARLADNGDVATGRDADVRTFATEAEVYAFIDLPWIAPELREDRGEIEAARAGKLPDLVGPASCAGDCHTHSNWSDGHEPIERMAELARARGLSTV